MKKYFSRTLLSALASLFMMTPLQAAPVALDTIVAVVNDAAIAESELKAELKVVKLQLRQQTANLPADSVLRSQVLDRLIMKHLQQQLAQSNNIIIDDNTLNGALNNIAKQNNMSLEKLSEVLASDGLSFNAYRESIRHEIMQQRLRQRYVNNRINISDSEVSQFIAQQKTQGRQDDEFRIGHILISLPEAPLASDIDAARKRGEEILALLASGDSFSQVAIAHSDGQLALSGGDMGWRKLGELPSLFANVAAEMKVGDMSHLIRSPSGFHIIHLAEHRGGKRHMVNQTKARHILIKTTELLDSAAAKQRLQELKIRLEGGEDFADLARANSDDKGSAAKGGELGWANPGDMVPAFEEMMDKTPEGVVSDIFETRFGWHLLEVMGRRQHDDTEQFVRNQARHQLFERKAVEEETLWLRRLRDDAYIEVRL